MYIFLLGEMLPKISHPIELFKHIKTLKHYEHFIRNVCIRIRNVLIVEITILIIHEVTEPYLGHFI